MNEPAVSTALVTGATGFVGSHLAHRLVSSGWQVHIVVRPDSSLRQLEAVKNQLTVHIHDGTMEQMLAIMEVSKPEVVFHLASLFLSQHAPRDVAPLVNSNVLFGTQLVESMVTVGVGRLLNTGTSWQHYENEDYNPVCLYAATKQAFEDILKFYTESTLLRAVTMILFDTYGPSDPRPKLVNLLATAARTQQAVAMSPGDQLLDLVHVDDVIDAYLLAAMRLMQGQVQRYERYAISSGAPIRLRELVEIYEEVSDTHVPVLWGRRRYRSREVMTAWDRGERLPGWRPKVPLREGLQRMA